MAEHPKAAQVIARLVAISLIIYIQLVSHMNDNAKKIDQTNFQ